MAAMIIGVTIACVVAAIAVYWLRRVALASVRLRNRREWLQRRVRRFRRLLTTKTRLQMHYLLKDRAMLRQASSAEGQLPPPLRIPELIIGSYNRWRQHSLHLYLLETADAWFPSQHTVVPLRSFVDSYEAFCARNELRAQSVSPAKATLRKHRTFFSLLTLIRFTCLVLYLAP
jgi:hypothetical protein